MLVAMLPMLAGCAPYSYPQCSLYGAGPSSPTRLIGIAGRPLTAVVRQPTVNCDPADRRSVTVKLIKPDNSEYLGSVTLSENGPEETIVFTPDTPGVWQLVVIFELSLGRVQVRLDVARERLETARTAIHLAVPPESCRPQPFMTRNGLVLCEVAGQIHTQRLNGPDTVFEGEQLMVSGNSVWSSSGQQLMHRTDTGTELRLDDTVTMPHSPLSDVGYTNQTTAFRAFDGPLLGAFTRYELVDGGLISSPSPGTRDDGVFVTNAGVFRFTIGGSAPKTLCLFDTDGGSRCEAMSGDVIRLDGETLWVDQADGTGPASVDAPFLGRAASAFVAANAYEVVFSRTSPVLVDHEPLFVRSLATPLSLIIRPIEHDFVLVYYGHGTMLGTRGNYVVIQPGTDSLVSFIEP